MAATPAAEPSASPSVEEATPAPEPVEDGDWSTANGGPRNTRARESAISASTVGDLEVAWSVELQGGGPYGSAAGAPVVADGVVYLLDLGANLYAIDLATGEVRWRFDAGAPSAGPIGPAVADGRVFVVDGGQHIRAVDATTGRELWSADLDSGGFQPFVAGNTVYVGTGNYAHVGGNSGRLHALDVATGQTRWVFQGVEVGFWGNERVNSGGGIWYPAAADLDRGLVYIGVGSPGPYPGTVDHPNAASRPGTNLYTCSIVALDVEDGTIRWYRQVVERDLFDRDFQLSPVLTQLEVDGRLEDVVIGAGKVGRVLAFDRDDGTILWDTPVGRHENDHLTELPPGEAVTVYPGIFGGVETPISVMGGRVFAPIVNMSTTHTADGHGALDGSSALLNASGTTDFTGGTGAIAALDLATGRVLWERALPAPNFGGATAVGDLVFTADYGGTIRALRQDTGDEVWTYDGGGGINAWPAVDGETILWPVGLGPTPRLIAFRLPAAPPPAGG
ncbi:MAG: PQQ-binding-like beta-propeller repeat protein [Dehalococcoidia bacterium]